uniref:BTB domain-containing protein n=2 Tax=Meloidogyne TaxID=189290 RepID=A0A6V7Y3L1_MELEN|nr:unnamed protein product [Meloidogyne enterolobii]
MESLKAETTWNIRDPERLVKALYYAESVELKSQPFLNPKFMDVTFELCLKLCYASSTAYVYLRQFGALNNNKVNTRYKIYVVKYGKQEVIISRSSTLLENQERMGYKEIQYYQYMYHGKLELRCEVQFDRYNDFTAFKESMEKMVNLEMFTDCCLKVGEHSLKCHRSILAKSSEVFFETLDQMDKNKAELETFEIPIVEFDVQVVQGMLQFLYTGSVKPAYMESHVENILLIAHKYKITNLKYECEVYMSNLIENSKLLNYCNIVNLYEATTLEKGIVLFIQLNKESVVNSQEWRQIKLKRCAWANNILERALIAK